MRKLFIISTVIFWLAVAGFWLADLYMTTIPVTDVSPVVEPAAKGYLLAEVAGHAKQDDCWMAIEGSVYDFTTYLPDHPSAPELILPWCGKEATQAWQTKNKGRAHSSRANQLLEKYRIGTLR
ncbi:MAG: cytochrome b5 domain-containing protein [Gallionella sp.]|nr:cytochrome b5 domain-containing protein [Gallionella sp.]